MKGPARNNPLYARIRSILESARSNVARSVNTTQVIANWLIGREIVHEEQRGQGRAGYADRLIEQLSKRLTRDFGQGYSAGNLRHLRQFSSTYPLLLADSRISQAAREKLEGIASKQDNSALRPTRTWSPPGN